MGLVRLILFTLITLGLGVHTLPLPRPNDGSPLLIQQPPTKDVNIKAVEKMAKKLEHVRIHRATSRPHYLKPTNPFPNKVNIRSVEEKDLLWKQLVAFFKEYPYFGVNDPQEELKFFKSTKDFHIEGYTHVEYHQIYENIPVFGASLVVHLNEKYEIMSVNGVFVPNLKLPTQPQVVVEDAIKTATQAVAQQQRMEVEDLEATETKTWIYRQNLTLNVEGSNHLAYEVIVQHRQSSHKLKERVFVDAIDGSVLAIINRHENAINREMWKQFLGIGSPFWKEGKAFPTSSTDANTIITTTKLVYDFFMNTMSYPSWDGEDGKMIGVFELNDKDVCPNAFWDGTSITFCPGLATIDVTAHEWAHAYTESTHGLIYQGQSGALNEAYSDIMAETIQQLSGIPQDYSKRATTNCISGLNSAPSLKWIVGDQVFEFGDRGLRDMWSPNCNEQPGFVSDSSYYCGSQDNGGVHINSGVPNKAYALLVDGGAWNGQTVAAIGLVKAVHIYLRAMFVYQTSSTTFPMHATALRTSCDDLVGVNLKDPKTGANSGQIISSANCDEVDKAIAAVELEETACEGGTADPSVAPVMFYAYPSAGPLDPEYYSFVWAFVTGASGNTAACIFHNITHYFGVYADVYATDNFEIIACSALPWSSEATVYVSVSNDGENWGDEAFIFEYYNHPQVEDVYPRSGLATGGSQITIIGSGFKTYEGCNPYSDLDYNGEYPDCLTCVFGDLQTEWPVKATMVSSTKVTCTLPPYAALIDKSTTVSLYFSMNHYIYYPLLDDGITYIFPEEPSDIYTCTEDVTTCDNTYSTCLDNSETINDACDCTDEFFACLTETTRCAPAILEAFGSICADFIGEGYCSFECPAVASQGNECYDSAPSCETEADACLAGNQPDVCGCVQDYFTCVVDADVCDMELVYADCQEFASQAFCSLDCTFPSCYDDDVACGASVDQCIDAASDLIQYCDCVGTYVSCLDDSGVCPNDVLKKDCEEFLLQTGCTFECNVDNTKIATTAVNTQVEQTTAENTQVEQTTAENTQVEQTTAENTQVEQTTALHTQGSTADDTQADSTSVENSKDSTNGEITSKEDEASSALSLLPSFVVNFLAIVLFWKL